MAARLAPALLLAHLVLSPLVFSHWTLEAFELPKVSLLLLTALGLGLGARREFFARDAVSLGFLLLAGSALLSTLTSMSPWTSVVGAHESFVGLPTVLAWTLLYFATRALSGPPARTRALLAAPVVASAVVATYALAQVLQADPLHWARTSTLGDFVRPFSTLGHPNHLAAYLAMTLPLAVWWAQRAARLQRPRALGGFVVLAVLSALAAVASLSRGGWLALGAALAVLGAGGLRGFSFRRPGRRAGLVLGATALLLVLGVLGAAHTGWLPSFIERVRHFGDGSTRLLIWRAALDTFAEHPLLGSGLDTFALAFERHRPAEYWRLEWGGTPVRAHQDVLHLLATQGLLGGLALAVLVTGLGLATVRAWRRLAGEERPLLVVLVAGLGAFAVQGLFNFTGASTGTLFVTYAALLSRLAWPGPDEAPVPERPHRVLGGAVALGLVGLLLHLGGPGRGLEAPGGVELLALGAMAVAAAGVLACCAALPWSEGPAPRPVRAPTPVRGHRGLALAAWALALGLAYGGVVRPLRASAACRRGDVLLASAPAQALPFLEASVALDSTRDVCVARLGTAAFALGRLDQAQQAYTLALARVPAEAYHHANLGRLLTERIREGAATPADALSSFEAALARDPHNGHILGDAALVALTVGDPARARDYATRATTLYPDFAPPRAVLGFLALSANKEGEAVELLTEALRGQWHGDERGARRVALANLAAALLRLGRAEEALAPAREAVQLAPEDPDLRFNLGRALEQLGRHEEARREYQTRDALQGLESSEARAPTP